jgi:aspartate/tyrosine/aromatic aminotransferase
MYRVEKTVGGNLELFIDDDVVPALRIESSRFTGIPTALSTGAVFFGSVVRDRLTTSTWEFFRYGISTGFEVSGYPVISESEMLTRFNNYINVIAEAGT